MDTTPTPALTINRGIALTQPVIGRIAMGHTVVKAGKALPVKDDHFSLTTLVQDAQTRVWETHPLQQTLCKANEKLRAIPVRLAYNDPNLTLRNAFTAFDIEDGRTVCVGNGIAARRATEEGVREIACPRPDACEYAARFRCKNMSRAYFRVEGQTDELGVFVLRTTSYNTLNYLGSRLAQLAGLTGGCVAGLPMTLVMVTKTTSQSYRQPVQFADLVTRPDMSLFQAIQEARKYQQAIADAGLSLEGMETALRAGLANSEFADPLEDTDEWLSDEGLVAAVDRQPGLRAAGLSGMDSLTRRLHALADRENPPAPGDAEAPPAAAEAADQAEAPAPRDGPSAPPATTPAAPTAAPAEKDSAPAATSEPAAQRPAAVLRKPRPVPAKGERTARAVAQQNLLMA